MADGSPKRDARYDILFEEVQIGPITAPNRFFSVPHATGHNPLMPNGSIGMREMKAEGGWGVVSMQLAEIDPTSDISNLPIEKFWDDTDVKSHALLVERIKKHGALTAIELAHTGIRARNMDTGTPVLGPSSMRILKPQNPIQSKAMDKQDIKAFRDSHKRAVHRAKQAGYDMVYVYAAHDASLVWHFLNPMYNQRTDEYGGSFENRLRLFREVLEDTVEAAAGDVAVAVRIPAHDFKSGSPLTYDNEARAVIESLAEVPDLWDVNVAGWPRDSGTSRFDDEGHQEKYTSYVKQVTTKPVVGVGRYTSADAMVGLIKKGVFDLIGASRPSIADPFLPNKIKEGRIDDIRECIGCNVCVSSDAYSVPLMCTQNPTISQEWRRGWHPENIPAAPKKENTLIIGSGPAGLECALTLAKAGHDVTVAEKASEFGGRVIKESALKGLSAWGRVKDYRLYQLQQMGNVSLYAESEIGAADVADFEADNIVVATGSKWRNDGAGATTFSAIEGFAEHALTPDDIMNGGEISGPIVIYDDDHYYMGNILAGHLAAKGHEVHLVCPLPSIAEWMGYTLESPRVLDEMVELGVHMHPNTTVHGWNDGALEVSRSDSGRVLPPIKGAHLVAVGARLPDDALLSELRAQSAFEGKVTGIGDCLAPGIIQAAVFSGHAEARRLIGDVPKSGIYKRETPVLFDR
ncbi:FAD-dependent oxidoreductase [Yoonia sp. SS1-5]|uniref:FAD-dependent oxidoreductase n=1 Tax=Yoonia rhodophyticola TaxID=3137370 RepID=A0AAN0M6P4_9RHOB